MNNAPLISPAIMWFAHAIALMVGCFGMGIQVAAMQAGLLPFNTGWTIMMLFAVVPSLRWLFLQREKPSLQRGRQTSDSEQIL